MNTPCIRCGKVRVFSRELKEEIQTAAGVSLVLHTQTVCPDPACQKIVEAKLAALRKQAEEIQERFLLRARAKKAEALEKRAEREREKLKSSKK